MGFLLPQWKHRNLIRGENADYMPETWSTFDTCLVNPSTTMETVMLSDDWLEAVKVLRWYLFCLLQRKKRNPHNPLLKLLQARLEGGGAFQKYLLYPDSETTRSMAPHLIGLGRVGRGEPGDKARGGWGRIYDLSIFPPFFFAAKQDCWLGACRDEWSSYKLVDLKDNTEEL